ncbi:MAG: hypothetical protein CMQ75_01800 [Gammaproteobacteria bacterium]|nr:hypothetical protein [Gammaproteobacteria bacterium]RPG99527.1 MAG: hypothetical protein CBC78_002000 [Candidatus Pelagibacter sp. TMED118]|tara:strand:- start:1480 stop:2391 length:912 start_codon:yes stop_codon:yes gene_type:complete
MSEKQGNGICLFCYNNEQLDYSKFAMLASTYAKKHLDLPVTLITDDGTKDWMEQNHSHDEIDACFDLMILDNSGVASKRNMRKHMDSPWTEFNAPFFNSNKHTVFYHTPYERTLLLDTDYILGNNFYKYIFDTDEPIALHRYAQYIGGELPYRNEITLNEAGIHHWWSTIVYFDQSEESKLFFDIWSHVKDNWEYYSLLYQYPKLLFRTDFCVSIACHLMNGMNNDNFIHDFLGQPLLNMDQKDDIAKVNGVDDLVFLKHNRAEAWKNILCRYTKQNLHIMNKRALDRHYNHLMTLAKEEASV